MTRTGGFRGTGLALLALGFVGACGSDSKKVDTGVVIDELPAAYAVAACESVNACLGKAVPLLLNGQDCTESTQKSVADLVDGVGEALKAGRVVYDGTKVEECLEKLRTAGCDFGSVGEDSACLDALDGTVLVGGECDFNAECDGTAYCKSNGTCPGTCTRAETEGGRCTSDSDCDPALECDETKGECYVPGDAGDRCGGGVAPECDAGLFCLGADGKTSTAGTCRRITDVLSAGEGDTCDPVAGPLCDPELYCAILSVTPAITAECRKGAAAGASCNVGFPDPCPTSQYCKAAQGTLTGTCTVRPAAGDPCAAGPFGDAPDICAPTTVCDGDTCRSKQPLGGTCAADAVCLSEHCVQGKCALDGACE